MYYGVLQKLFKAIVSHRYVPVAFGAGIVIPLLKNSGLGKSNIIVAHRCQPFSEAANRLLNPNVVYYIKCLLLFRGVLLFRGFLLNHSRLLKCMSSLISKTFS